MKLLYTLLLIPVTGMAWQADFKLPAPFATPSVRNNSRVIPRPEGAKLTVPAGFTVEEYLSDFKRVRTMVQGPHLEMLVADSAPNGQGSIYLYPDAGKGKDRKKLIENLDRPFGLAFWKDYLYVGEPTSIKRYEYDANTMTAGAGEEVVSLKNFGKGHNTRSILFDRKGEKMYVGIGSESNVEAGEDPWRAAINRFNPDGSGHEIFAAGTRNPIGLHWYPGTDTLWVTVQERDLLGDDLVPDYFTHVQQNSFYGWPYAYAGPNEDPRRKGEHPDLVDKVVRGDVLFPAHSANIDFAFYTGKQFPKKYQGGAFVAFHGSWNRSLRTGYKVVYVPFENGKPSGKPEDFLTGWMIAPDVTDVWGRPTSIFERPDGSLLIADDGGNKIWRVSYKQ